MDRFKDLIWFPHAHGLEVTLIGVGGIGSWAAILLARAGLRPIIIDDDIVDSTNISGQFFFKDQIMQEKVVAIQNTVDYFGGNLAYYVSDRFNERSDNDYLMRITIIGTDNMKSRKDTFSAWERLFNYDGDVLFIDGRLNAESFQIFCIQSREDGNKYRNYLYNDDEIPEVSCTAKQTTHYAAMIAANIVRFVTNFLSSTTGIPTYVPFLYEINGILPDQVNIVQEQIEQPKVKEVVNKTDEDLKKAEKMLGDLNEEVHAAAGVPLSNHGVSITGTSSSVTINPDLPF